MMSEARCYLKFACEVYGKQHREGRIFVHEHPATAKSWDEQCVVNLLKQKGVYRTSLDMCRFNLQSIDPDGISGLVKKRTGIITNSLIMSQHLSRHCLGGHSHVQLKGARRATEAATYTVEFCEAIVEGYKRHLAEMDSKKLKKNLFDRHHYDIPCSFYQ